VACASKPWSISSACKNLRSKHPLRGPKCSLQLQYAPLELFCLWTKVHRFFLPKGEGVVFDEVFFQMFDMSIRSGDIRDQSRKLSEIARQNLNVHTTCSHFYRLHFCPSISSPALSTQWRIQLWADQAAPIDQNLGLLMAAKNSLPQRRGQIFI